MVEMGGSICALDRRVTKPGAWGNVFYPYLPELQARPSLGDHEGFPGLLFRAPGKPGADGQQQKVEHAKGLKDGG